MSPCPSRNVLLALLSDAVAVSQAQGVEAHIQGCPDCQQALEELTRNPPSQTFVPEGTAPLLLHGLGEAPPAWVRRLASRAEPFPDLPGYEVLAEVGRGGIGVVYKARQVALDRVVALKRLRDADPSQVARLRREAEALGRLQHPNIVQVFEVRELPAGPVLCLEFCTGGSLDRRLAAGALPPAEAAALVQVLAGAIHAAHQAGIVHRDLKPANVLLSAAGGLAVPKISDFGLAKVVDDSGQTRTGAVLGTPSYMAPEQARGDRDVGPAADTYALGAILYECLTGRPPFKAASPLETLAQVADRDPVPVRTLQPQVPRALETICLKCLSKAPAARYATARELADDLERFLRHEPIRARPIGAVVKVWRWARRNPVPAGLLAAGLLAPAVALVALSLLSARLVRSSALESAAQQAELLEQANNEYSRIVQRVEEAHFPVNKTVPPTPGTVPLSIPATFLHDVGEQLRQASRTGIQVRQYSDHPFPWRRRQGGPRDAFQVEALRRLRAGEESVHEFTEIDGRRVVRYAQARVMRPSCVDCHNKHPQSPRKDWQVGDVRGVLEIVRPLDRDEARVGGALRLALLASAAVSALLLAGSLLVLWAQRRLRPARAGAIMP
jgi:tRNA A-37 threonylcarbamoyl transferase component Bud32